MRYFAEVQMALMSCGVCGAKISDCAPTCPQCGDSQVRSLLLYRTPGCCIIRCPKCQVINGLDEGACRSCGENFDVIAAGGREGHRRIRREDVFYGAITGAVAGGFIALILRQFDATIAFTTILLTTLKIAPLTSGGWALWKYFSFSKRHPCFYD